LRKCLKNIGKSLKNIEKFLKNNCQVKSGNPSKILGNAFYLAEIAETSQKTGF